MHAKFLKRSAHRRSDGGVPIPRLAALKAEVRDVINPLPNGPVTLTVTVVHGPTGNAPILTLSNGGDETGVLPPPSPTQTTPTLSVTISPSIVPIPPATSTTALNTVSTQSPMVSVSYLPPTPTTTATNSNSINPNSSSASAFVSSSGLVSTSAAEDNGTTTVNLSSGAVAGIVIGCLLVLVAAVVFGLRKRSTNNRLRLRGMWANSKALRLGRSGNGVGFGILGARGDLAPTPYTYQPPKEAGFGATERQRDLDSAGEGRMSYVGGRPATATFADAAAGTGARNSASARSMSTLGLELPKTLPSAFGYAESVSSPLRSAAAGSAGNSAVVVRTFVPSLPDELTISTGETLEVIEIFDDGWAECVNRNGDVGMVPLECLDRALFAPKDSNDNARNSRRYTSLPSARR